MLKRVFKIKTIDTDSTVITSTLFHELLNLYKVFSYKIRWCTTPGMTIAVYYL